MRVNTWGNFETTGKINDYLNYKKSENINLVNEIKPAEALINADKNSGDCIKTTEYR